MTLSAYDPPNAPVAGSTDESNTLRAARPAPSGIGMSATSTCRGRSISSADTLWNSSSKIKAAAVRRSCIDTTVGGGPGDSSRRTDATRVARFVTSTPHGSPNTGDKLRSGARVRLGRRGHEAACPFWQPCRRKLRQLHPLVRPPQDIQSGKHHMDLVPTPYQRLSSNEPKP